MGHVLLADGMSLICPPLPQMLQQLLASSQLEPDLIQNEFLYQEAKLPPPGCKFLIAVWRLGTTPTVAFAPLQKVLRG